GIPPWYGNQHVVGRGQIETEAACLEADEKEITLPCLERRHATCTLGGRGSAIEVLIGDPCRIQWLPQERQKIDELAEDKRLVTVRHEVVREIGERLHFRADNAEFGTH